MSEVVYGVLIGVGLFGWMLYAYESQQRRWFQTRLHETVGEYNALVKAAMEDVAREAVRE